MLVTSIAFSGDHPQSCQPDGNPEHQNSSAGVDIPNQRNAALVHSGDQPAQFPSCLCLYASSSSGTSTTSAKTGLGRLLLWCRAFRGFVRARPSTVFYAFRAQTSSDIEALNRLP